MKLTDDDLLGLVKEERRNSIGFEHDADLTAARQLSLNYYKGAMPDVPALPNRSKATSSDVADAIETVIPDLVEIFIGDDVATFQPIGEEDEEQAQQETDYLNHVFFNENPGFLLLYTGFKDACQVKTGVWKWCWEEYEDAETFQGKSEEELAVASQEGKVSDVELASEGDGYTQGPTYNFSMVAKRGRLKVYSVAPEDFTVAADTVSLTEATYCAMRSRPRAQDLIADGTDPEIVSRLPAYNGPTDTTQQARDTAGEGSQPQGSNDSNLHRVEIVEHLIRVDADGDGKPELWKVTTGDNEAVLISKEAVDEVNYAAITPFIITHRFYGESLSDKLIEIQKINTALMRMTLDTAYFALNQRVEISDDGVNENTIEDWLRNEPGVPVRTKRQGTIRPIQAGALNFDPFAGLEYFATVAERRTGVVRNAQGLNPDTLHDTKGGMMALMSASQKRVRMIARIFAETGVKDLFLGMHATLRKHASKEAKARLRGEWVTVSPTQWSARNDMNIEIGLGSAGREHDLIVLREMLSLQMEAVSMQGGAQGPLVTLDNLYASVTRLTDRAGIKGPERYWSDPKKAQPQQPKPDPKMEEVKAKVQLEQQKAMADAQLSEQKALQSAKLDEAKANADLQHQREKAAMDAQVAREKHALDLELKRQTTAAELEMRREQLVAEFDLKREQMALDHHVKMEAAKAKATETSGVGRAIEAGGEPG